MTSAFKAACVQNCASSNIEQNLDQCDAFIREAAGNGADLILLPEYFSCLDVRGMDFRVGAHEEAAHPAMARFATLAAETGKWLLLGSIAVTHEGGKITNRSLLMTPDGKVAARYDKIHLFDVDLPGGESYRESAVIKPGDRAVVAQTPWGGLGLSVCYDLRFPQLYRALAKAGAAFLTVPAAFARTTGEAHWHVLLRSRAIETGCYVLAPCQSGLHGESESFGHSLIVDPWGRILADGGTEEGIVYADIDPSEVARVRNCVPALAHDRPFDVD